MFPKKSAAKRPKFELNPKPQPTEKEQPPVVIKKNVRALRNNYEESHTDDN